MPPIHPALVHFPIALIVFSAIADLLGYVYGNETLTGAGWWSMLGAALGGVLAAGAGYFDMTRENLKPAARDRVRTHMKIGIAAVAVVAALTFWRWIIFSSPGYSINTLYLIGVLAGVLLIFFQAWLGGEIVYGYGVGVAPDGQGTERPEDAEKRVSAVIGKVSEED